MSNTVQHKRSTTSGTSPSASDLAVGEIGINTADRTLFTKHSNGNVVNVADVESDTSPQLGGDLDANGKNIKLGDFSNAPTANQLSFGASDDFTFNYNGSLNIASIISGGDLRLQSGNQGSQSVTVETSSETMAEFNPNSSVDLYYNNSKKLETTSSGIQTTGTISLNGAYTFPTSDGSANQVLQTDGSGTLSFATVSGGSGISNLIEDTTPQLGGQLDLNGNNITTNSSLLLQTTNAAKSLEFSVLGQTIFRVTPTGVELADANDIAYFGGDGTDGGVTLANGYIDIKGKSVSEATYVNFYCESSNAHAVKLQAPAHADFSGNITTTLPNTTGTLVTSNAQRRIEVVSSLPSSPDSNTIYFVT